MTPIRFQALALAVICAASLIEPAVAQVFPSRGDTPVTDDADMIDAATEARLVARIAGVQADTGAQIEVVTLLNTALYTGGEDIDVYAGLLADALGLSAAPDGQFVLFVVFREDRELRIETGTAYGAQSSAAAQAIITELVTPQFQTENYSAGIEAGVEGIITRIMGIVPATPASAPSGEGGGGLWWLVGLVAVPVGGVVWANGRRAAKLAATPCPACGKTGLTESRTTLAPATETVEGRGETRNTCSHCGHVTAVPYAIARLEPTASVAAKAGQKKGGGASGQW